MWFHTCPLQTMYQQSKPTCLYIDFLYHHFWIQELHIFNAHQPLISHIHQLRRRSYIFHYLIQLHQCATQCGWGTFSKPYTSLHFFFIFEAFQSHPTSNKIIFTTWTNYWRWCLFSPPGIQLLIEWSKKIQTRDSIHLQKIPSFGGSRLCPVRAIKNLMDLTPGTENSPLFQIKNEWAQMVTLTDTKVRRNFSIILQRLGLPQASMSLHTFRHLGATLAFSSNASIQGIESWHRNVWLCVEIYCTRSQCLAESG